MASDPIAAHARSVMSDSWFSVGSQRWLPHGATNEMMPGIDGTLHIVPDHPAALGPLVAIERASGSVSEICFVFALHHLGVQLVQAFVSPGAAPRSSR